MHQLYANPENLTLLAHAALFLQSGDDETAAALLERARALDPTNGEWLDKLARLHEREMHLGSSEATWRAAEKALGFYELAFELSDRPRRDTLVTVMAKIAFEADRHETLQRKD